MKDKKSFIIHKDSLSVLDDLTDAQAGELFKAIREYQNNGSVELNGIVKIAFNPFRNQFIRDNTEYLKLCEKNRQIALKRHSTKSTTGTSGNQSLPQATKSTDKDSDSDSDKVYSRVVVCLNKYANKNFKHTSTKTKRLIDARLNDGFTIKDFGKVIAVKSKQWKGTEQEKYLRPETLFGTKFEGYLNEL